MVRVRTPISVIEKIKPARPFRIPEAISFHGNLQYVSIENAKRDILETFALMLNQSLQNCRSMETKSTQRYM